MASTGRAREKKSNRLLIIQQIRLKAVWLHRRRQCTRLAPFNWAIISPAFADGAPLLVESLEHEYFEGPPWRF